MSDKSKKSDDGAAGDHPLFEPLKKPEWEEQEPIDDLETALGLLAYGLLILFPEDIPHIRIQHAGGRYKMEVVSTDRHPVTPELAEELVSCEYVSGIFEFDITTRHESRYEFKITENGSAKRRELYEARRDHARTKLEPGIHPGTHGWSSLYSPDGEYREYDKKSPHYNQKAFVFKNPLEQRFAVFEDGEVVELQDET